MTQENRELLLIDLLGRLPYGVKVLISLDIRRELGLDIIHNFIYNNICGVRPYLRPMSDMTEEERKIYSKLLFADLGGVYEDYYKALDYLNSLHIDYRGLIPKGLALEAPEGMYK